MAIWLIILGILIIVGLYFVKCRTRVEGFGEFLHQQKSFGNSQNVYFHDQAMKGIFTNPGLNLAGLNEAAAQPDYDLPVNKFKNMTNYFIEDPENAWTEQDNSMCRGAKHPRDLPARANKEIVGCGWYFIEDQDRASVGAIGTRRGPAMPSSLPTGGTWIWNRAEAIKAEDTKQCKAIRDCEFIDLDDVRGVCGFCREKGHGVPIHSNGTLKYPDDADGGCGSKLITRAGECVEPIEEITAGNNTSCGTAGRPSPDGSKRLYTARECSAMGGTHMADGQCVRPDDGGNFSIECAGLNVPATSSANRCSIFGNLNRACVVQLATKNRLSSSGGMVNLIQSRVRTPMANDALKALSAAGIDIPSSLWNSEKNDAATVNAIFRRIASVARNTDKSDATNAAKFLVNGTLFNPCSSYKNNQTGPFNVDCLQRAFRKAGCQAGGSSYPSQRSAVAELANKTWGDINKMFRKTFDDMKSSDPRTQDMALKNCLGSGSEFYREKGKTCWKCADGINVPLRRNDAGDIECMSFDGFNCAWQASKAGCDNLLASPPSRIQPLVCGEDHRRKWGSTGYTNPIHWCARANASGSHNGPIAASDFEYKGCFNDSSVRAIPRFVGNVRTAEECKALAERNNANTFGLQFFGQCWVGNNPPYNRYGASRVNCGTLGTAWTNQVYQKN